MAARPCPVRVRPMRPSDVAAVAAIEAAVQPRPWPASVFRDELERPDRVYRVATGRRRWGAGPAPVRGYGGASIGAGEAHVLTVAVDADHRRRGIGLAVVLALVGAVRDQGVTAVTLEVRESNVAAQRMYERLGFVSYGLRPGYYQDNREAARILWLRDLATGRVRDRLAGVADEHGLPVPRALAGHR